VLRAGLAEMGIAAAVTPNAEPSEGTIVLGTPASLPSTDVTAGECALDDVGPEGFVVQPHAWHGRPCLLVASTGERGVLYGAAAVLEQLRLGRVLDAIRLRERPALEHRNLWAWSGPSPDPAEFLSFAAIDNLDAEPRFRDLVARLAGMRINAVTLWPSPAARPDYGPRADEAMPRYRKLTDFLRERLGVEVYLFGWYELERGHKPPFHGWPICPFDERVRSEWRARIERLCRALPALTGYVLAGAGGDWLRAPFECECERCRARSKRERLIEGMKLIAGPLAEFGGKLIYKAVTDRPTYVRTEVEHFANLDDALPANVTIAHKNFYKDFRQSHPLHPIFYAHEIQNERRRPYHVESQIFGEYRGHDQFPCVMADRWAEVFPRLAERNYTGAIGVCSFSGGDRWDHPLNLANWYAFGRLAWDPADDPDAILHDWARQSWGEAADEVVALCRLSYAAATKLMFFRGILIQNHSYLPTIDFELEASLVGPWHDLPMNEPGYIGRGHDISMYPPHVQERIRNDPALRLWAHRVPLTAELAEECVAQVRQAGRIVEEMRDRWARIAPTANPERHVEVADQFQRNVWDARLWYEDIRLYFDYKLGRLTRSELGRRLDAIRATFDARPGSDLTNGDHYDRFLAEWQRVYDGVTTRRVMEGIWHDPNGTAFLPGLAPEPAPPGTA
jgi:alpha-glucuronidase